MMTSSMVTSPMMEIIVSAGYDTQMEDDNWISTGINSDNRDFELDENKVEEEWLDEDSNNDEDEDKDDDEDD